MKFGEFTDAYASANNFSFTNNPKVMNINNGTQKKLILTPFRSVQPYFNVSAVTPLSVSLTTVFTGADRVDELSEFMGKFYSKDLKKLWIDGTYFIPVIGSTDNRPVLAKRANFIDLTANFISPIPFYWNTEITKTFTGVSATTTDLAGFTNTGYAPAIIYKIVVTATSGIVTGIIIGDLAKDGSDVDGDNILDWSSSVGIDSSGSEYMSFYLIYDINRKGIKWYYFKEAADGVTYGDRDFSGDNYEDGLRVNPQMTGGTTQTFSAQITGTGTPVATIVFTYYNSDYMR